VLAGKDQLGGHLLHGKAADVGHGHPADGASAHLLAASGADHVATGALHNRRHHVAKANGTLQQGEQEFI